MITKSRLLVASATILLSISAAAACPLCHTARGEQVRAGIFGSDFSFNLFVVVLPFLVFAAIIVALHYGFSPKKSGTRQTESSDLNSSTTTQGGNHRWKPIEGR